MLVRVGHDSSSGPVHPIARATIVISAKRPLSFIPSITGFHSAGSSKIPFRLSLSPYSSAARFLLGQITPVVGHRTSSLLVFVRSLEYASPVILEPCKMGKGTVGFCHLMRIFTLLNCITGTTMGINDLARESFPVRHTFSRTGSRNKPHHA